MMNTVGSKLDILEWRFNIHKIYYRFNRIINYC